VQDREGERERERENVYAWIAVIASSSSHEFSRLSLSVSFSARSIFNSISTHSRASLASFPVLHPPPRSLLLSHSFSSCTRVCPPPFHIEPILLRVSSFLFVTVEKKKDATGYWNTDFFFSSLSPPPSLSLFLSFLREEKPEHASWIVIIRERVPHSSLSIISLRYDHHHHHHHHHHHYYYYYIAHKRSGARDDASYCACRAKCSRLGVIFARGEAK